MFILNTLLSKDKKEVLRNFLVLLLEPFIFIKWLKDKRTLPLEKERYDMYVQLHATYFFTLFSFPDLSSPSDYNEKIQWLKLFDERSVQTQCCDKVLMRDYVKNHVGEGYLPKIYQVAASYDGLDFDALPKSFVLKTNHDSGSVYLVKDKALVSDLGLRDKIDSSLKSKFGFKTGEWPYLDIPPKIFAEEYLDAGGFARPADFKFHCVDGKVKWLQYIYDRGANTKEVIVDRAGNVMKVHFSENMMSCNEFKRPECWSEMITVSEELSKAFKYVRIDLYFVSNKIYVGEMTYFPMYGCYKGEGQKELGKLLDFDLLAVASEGRGRF